VDPDDGDLGLFLALLIIYLCRSNMDAKQFAEWGWRIPFWLSLVLLCSRSTSG
jgi:hypothetical protein